MTPVRCETCDKVTDPLAVFPGGVCLDCYAAIADATPLPSARELVEAWGGTYDPRYHGEQESASVGAVAFLAFLAGSAYLAAHIAAAAVRMLGGAL